MYPKITKNVEKMPILQVFLLQSTQITYTKFCEAKGVFILLSKTTYQKISLIESIKNSGSESHLSEGLENF